MANDAHNFTLFFDLRTGVTRYRWRLRGVGGETLAWSENGYVDKYECEAAIESMKEMYPNVPLVDLTGSGS